MGSYLKAEQLIKQTVWAGWWLHNPPSDVTGIQKQHTFCVVSNLNSFLKDISSGGHRSKYDAPITFFKVFEEIISMGGFNCKHNMSTYPSLRCHLFSETSALPLCWNRPFILLTTTIKQGELNAVEINKINLFLVIWSISPNYIILLIPGSIKIMPLLLPIVLCFKLLL